MSKRWIAAATAVTAVLGLSACGNTSTGGGEEEESAGSGTSTAATDFPKKGKTVDVVVAFDAGGPADSMARTLAPALEEGLGTNVQVTNKPGAGGQVGYTFLSRAKPDGYTIGIIGTPSIIISSLDSKRDASYQRDSFAPLGLQVVDPGIVGVAPDSPYKTAKDLIDAAKADPGKLRASTTGLQTGEHFAIADLEQKTGAKLRPVHFNDGASAATAAFLGGNFEVYVGSASDVTDLVKQNKIRVLGVLDSERSPSLPGVPTFKEQGYDVQQTTARGWAAPAGLPADVQTKLEAALSKAIQDPEVVAQMKKLGLNTRYMAADEYDAYLTQLEAGIKSLMPAVAEST